MSSRISAVFFDVGSTLIRPNPSVAETMAEVAQARGHKVSTKDFTRYMDQMDAFYECEYERNGDFWCTNEGSINIWLNLYRYVCGLVGLDDDAEGIAHDSYRAFRHADHWEAYPDVVPCLEALKGAGYRLAVVSNWDAYLKDLLEGMGLMIYFEEVFASSVLGYRKPDPAIFANACEHMGVLPPQVVHVGDLPSADGDGAAAARIQPIIIDRHNAWADCAYKRVQSLEDVPSVIAGMII